MLVFLKRSVSLIGGLGLEALPKCPFCYVIYSTSITICGVSAVPQETVMDTTFIAGLTGLIFVILLLNFRRWRTIISLVMVGLGGLLLVYVTPRMNGNDFVYILGSTSVIAGVILNKKSFIFKHREKQHKLLNCYNC